jgi:hypothetical protein
MRSPKFIQLLVLFCLGISPMVSINGQIVEYSHPQHAFSFAASPLWDQEFHNVNGKVFEVTNPNHNMKISMSFIPGCKNARKHMKQLSGLSGLVILQKPYDTILNSNKAVMMHGTSLQGKEPFSQLIIGIPCSDGLYLMEISCPAECYINHKAKVNTILGSLRVEV